MSSYGYSDDLPTGGPAGTGFGHAAAGSPPVPLLLQPPAQPPRGPAGAGGSGPPARQSVLQKELFGSRVKREEIMHLSRQLSAFIRAGLPLIEAVHILGAEATNSALKPVMASIAEGLRRGDKLTDCLDRHPRVFPEFYRGIVRSAELTGQLERVLDQLARYLERDLDARRKIKAALVYPSIIAAMSLVTVVVLASFVLPGSKPSSPAFTRSCRYQPGCCWP